MTATILAINAGSTSIKFSLFTAAPGLSILARGAVKNLGAQAMWDLDGSPPQPITGPCDHHRAFEILTTWLRDRDTPDFVVHRIVHGGPDFIAPTKIDPTTLIGLERLVPLAPLHQPFNVMAVRMFGTFWPNIPQYACFDTAFHAGHNPLIYQVPLPEQNHDPLVRRYGFHGLSCQWVTEILARDYPHLAAGRVVIAHLGGGSSLTAVRAGQSIDSSMGMTALDGVPMTTRCGALDPGLLFYLLRHHIHDVDDLEKILYQQSGLKALSGTSGDMKSLLIESTPAAQFAVDYYALRVAQMVGRLAVTLGGIDGLVFTGGIGEHAAPVRTKICHHLEFLHIPQILVIPTDEERMMVMDVLNHHFGGACVPQ